MNWRDMTLDPRKEKKGIPLYSYNEIPHFMQGNPYITHGYRAFLSSGQCFRSFCTWSNETINVWTHLLGFLIFLGLTIYDNVIMIPFYQGSLFDHVIYTGFLSCYQFCMFASAAFHLFSGGNETIYKRWFGIDLAGISVGIMGCYLPGIYYAYYCFTFWRNVYLILASSLILVTILVQLHPRYLSAHWYSRRIMLFCAMVGFGVAPTMHWVFLYGGVNTPIVKLILPRVIVLYLMGFTALIFYATRFPEVCCPGRVDYIGSSHQLWHVLVVIAFLWWHQTGVIMMEFVHNSDPCKHVVQESLINPYLEM
ncbi:progestin and adipoQ receptor family member 3-like [Lytechinus pictus]|uniref:progestin and adipoQ receptor family member 3-like n=1 Tax=Lytechinus pictus TaxID=7653 RepID=UPI0030B9F228